MRVISKKNVGKRRVFDIVVPNNENFVANGAVVHNCTQRGIRGVFKAVKPDCFEDVVAVTALYRPGPLGAGVDKLYGENKKLHADGMLTFEHPILERILSRTHGCLIYQEQLMQIARDLGKMEFKDVQRIRKVLLKKDKSKSEEFLKKENDELQGKFIAGCLENGLTKDRAEQWWKDMLYFGGYGFNVAHAASYSVVTMQTAYLATYYPIEFYAALLTRGQSAEKQDDVSDIKASGVKILPVDVNKSKGRHTVEDGSIRLSLLTVTGVGEKAVEKIVAGQPYKDWLDFIERSGASKSVIEPLIQVGAFRSLEPNVKKTMEMYTHYQQNPKYKNKRRGRGENPVCWEDYVNLCTTFPEVEDYSDADLISLETTHQGFSICGSPFEILGRREKLQKIFGDVTSTYKDFIEGDDETCAMPVILKGVKERPQKKGGNMAFLKFGVESGEEFEAPAFAGIWKWISHKAKIGSVYIATFNRKESEPERLIFGRPGWAHSQHSAQQYLINLDEISM